MNAAQPEDTVATHFDVDILATLSGRHNTHWLVERHNQRLVLHRWWQPINEIVYELQVVEHLAARGWPVASVIDGPFTHVGAWWSSAPFLAGKPRPDKNTLAEQQERGRLLATFHADLAQLTGVSQRGRWRRCEAVLDDPTIDLLLTHHEPTRAEEVRIVRWHLHRARAYAAEVQMHNRLGVVVHGDWTT